MHRLGLLLSVLLLTVGALTIGAPRPAAAQGSAYPLELLGAAWDHTTITYSVQADRDVAAAPPLAGWTAPATPRALPTARGSAACNDPRRGTGRADWQEHGHEDVELRSARPRRGPGGGACPARRRAQRRPDGRGPGTGT